MKLQSFNDDTFFQHWPVQYMTNNLIRSNFIHYCTNAEFGFQMQKINSTGLKLHHAIIFVTQQNDHNFLHRLHLMLQACNSCIIHGY